MKALHIGLLTFMASVALLAEPVETLLERLIAHRDLDEDNSGLPKHIMGLPGQMSLVADFAAARSHEPVPVYLINQTAAPVKLKAQDLDVYLKLETQNKDGSWSRAQSHRYSGCGNSYDFEPMVRPGHFITIKGYQPLSGKQARVRYKLYLQDAALPVSNEGPGLVDPKEIENAFADRMALESGTFEFISKLALGTRVGEDHSLLWNVAVALASGRFEKARAWEVLDQMAAKFPRQQEEIKRWKKMLWPNGEKAKSN